jgi:DNA-binding NarL/FixJ family response regulator
MGTGPGDRGVERPRLRAVTGGGAATPRAASDRAPVAVAFGPLEASLADALADRIDATAGVRLVGFDLAVEAVPSVLAHLAPDVVVVAARAVTVADLQTWEEICPALGVMLITRAGADERELAVAHATGAHAVLSAEVSLECLVSTIATVAEGGCLVVGSRAPAQPQAAGARPRALTRREREVAGLLRDDDLTYEMIAERLGVSPATINSHVTRIYRTLGIYSRRELKAIALEDTQTPAPEARPLRLSCSDAPAASRRRARPGISTAHPWGTRVMPPASLSAAALRGT